MKILEYIKSSRKDRICNLCFSNLPKGKPYTRRTTRIREEDGDYFEHEFLCSDCLDYEEDKGCIDYET